MKPKKMKHKLCTDDIIYCEADGSYSYIYTLDGIKNTIVKRLKLMEQLLPPEVFFRCHRKFIINLQMVENINIGNKMFVTVYKKKIPVSESNRKELKRRLSENLFI
jgi:two-component system, LytTR family, response regulator